MKRWAHVRRAAVSEAGVTDNDRYTFLSARGPGEARTWRQAYLVHTMTDAEFVKSSMVNEPPAQFGGKWTLDKAEDVVKYARA